MRKMTPIYSLFKNQIKENQTLIIEVERQKKEYEGLLTAKDNEMESMKKDFENDKGRCRF